MDCCFDMGGLFLERQRRKWSVGFGLKQRQERGCAKGRLLYFFSSSYKGLFMENAFFGGYFEMSRMSHGRFWSSPKTSGDFSVALIDIFSGHALFPDTLLASLA